MSVDPRVDEAARAAVEGRLVVLPTDTVYGIGTRPDDPGATARLFEAKRRPRDLELPVLVPTFAEAERVARFDERAERLAEAFWPGPLTLVLPRAGDSEAWDLGGDRATIGVRLPGHRLARAVLDRSGPLAVTSANVSGQPTPTGCDDLVGLFGDLVAVYLCQQEPLAGAASTVIDLAHGEPRVIRHGALPQAALDAVIAEAELPP